MPRKWHEFQGGTWTTVDPVANYNALVANTAADAIQDTKLDLKAAAMSGDMVYAASPATPGSSTAAVLAAIAGAAQKFTRSVTFTLKTAAGDTHTWFSGTVPLTIADNAAGAAAIADSATDATFVAGVATVVVEYTGTWAEGNTSTLTLDVGTLLGYTLVDVTSVDTLIA
jgi:hypothetical protein